MPRKWFFLTDRVERWDDILNIEFGVEEMERLTARAEGVEVETERLAH